MYIFICIQKYSKSNYKLQKSIIRKQTAYFSAVYPSMYFLYTAGYNPGMFKKNITLVFKSLFSFSTILSLSTVVAYLSNPNACIQ